MAQDVRVTGRDGELNLTDEFKKALTAVCEQLDDMNKNLDWIGRSFVTQNELLEKIVRELNHAGRS
jgi:cell division protein ZapA (FtsZ GTPase activity inhibitor)